MSKHPDSIPHILSAVLASCVAIASLAILSAPVQAADDAIDPKFREAIRAYVLLQGSVEQMGMSVAYDAANEALMAIAQSGVEVTEPMQAIVFEQALETFGKKFGDVEFLTDLWTPIYAKHYSEKEVRELIAFYQSPLGKKSLELFAPINEAGMLAVQESAFAIIPGFQVGVNAKFEAAGINITPAP